jgi:tRNA U54 and U55 pseudouridine synthase Pus10
VLTAPCCTGTARSCWRDAALEQQHYNFSPARPPQVLHRRANLGRPKVVHEMHAEPLAGRSPHYFALRLRTQAGAYIKEFVHGELGWAG